jgi:hypothetical protein
MKVSAIQASASENCNPRRNLFIRFSNSFMSTPEIENPVEKANNDLEWIKLKAKEDIEYRGIKQANATTYLGAVKQQIDLNGITIKEAKQEIDNTFKIELVGAFDE